MFDGLDRQEEGRETRPQAQLKPLPVELLAGLLSCAASFEAAAEELARVQDLMSCVEEPAPTPVLLALSAEGRLGDRIGPGDDDDYCWPLAQPLDWSGATFTRLCVVTDDAASLSDYPQFYWSQSLAPWTEVWLISSASPAALAAWAGATLPAGSRFEVDPLGDGADRSALSCSEWHFPLPG